MEGDGDAQRLVLILAQPSHWRDGVQTALEALPCVAVSATGDRSAASRLDEADPTVVVVEAKPYGYETRCALRWLKAAYREVRCLVLVGQAEEARAVRDEGADDVLPRAASAESLRRAVERLLSSGAECRRSRDRVALPSSVGAEKP